MNLLTLFALRFLEEGECFWVLVSLVRDILSGYYEQSMLLGMRVDQLVLQHLVRNRMPALSKHLDDLGVPVALLSYHWFLQTFVNILLVRVTARVWDQLF